MEPLFYLSLFSLGALDALQPGHAKALVSSALVGTNANVRHVLLLGFIVTLTHTVINCALAFLVTFFALKFFPDEFVRYVEVLAGAAVVLIALYLIRQRFFQTQADCCDHDHHHTGDAVPQNLATMGVWQIVALGLVSGLSPCPVVLSALISAIALGKGWAAVWGISVFSLGMGAVLIGVGCFTLYGMKKARLNILSSTRYVLRFSQACAVLVLFVGSFLLLKALFFYEPEQEAPLSLIYLEEKAP